MLPERIHSRGQTCRSYEQAKRSFYKLICKRSWYDNLIITNSVSSFARNHPDLWRAHMRPCHNWTYGYPQFTACGKSRAIEAWDEAFLIHYREARDHRERIRYEKHLLDERDKRNQLVAAIALCKRTILKPEDLPKDLIELQVIITAAKTLLRRNKTR